MQKIIFYSLLFSGIVSSQNIYSQTKFDEVVYLKNGTIIRGLIVEFIPEQSIKIKGKDGNVFFYRMDEIEKITREPYNLEKITIGNKQIKQSGFTNTTDLTLGMSSESGEEIAYGLQTVAGYLFNPYFSMGAGIGIESFMKSTYIPLFFDIHAYFSNSIVSPYFSIDIGKAFGSGNNKGGALINPSLGVKAYFNAKTAVDFSIGYKTQEFEYEHEWNGTNYSYSRSTQFIVFKTGITF